MVARWAQGALALVVAARAIPEIDDRAALVQSAVKLHEQAPELDKEDMVRSFYELLLQEKTQRGLQLLHATAPQKVEELARKAAAKASLQDLKMEVPSPEVRFQRIQEATFEDLPPELKFAVNNLKKGALDIPYHCEPMSMIRKHIPGAESLPVEALIEMPKLGKFAAEAFARGGPVVDDLIKQIPKLYRLVQDQSVFEPISAALQFVGPKAYNSSMTDDFLNGFGEFAVKLPTNRALQLFQTETEITSAQSEGTNSSRGPCFGKDGMLHLEAVFTPGIRWYPTTLMGYYLQLNIGTKLGYTPSGARCFKNTQLEIVVERKFNAHIMGNWASKPIGGRTLGGITWKAALGASLSGPEVDPLRTIERRHIDVAAFVSSNNFAALPVDADKPYKSTFIINGKVGPGFVYSRFWAEAFADLTFVPSTTIELKHGWSIAAQPVLGLIWAPSEPGYSDFHASTKISLDNLLGGDSDAEMNVFLGREASEGKSWNFGRY